MKVEIWSDVVCPWCHVGKARFEEAMRRLGWDESDVEITFRPFELDRHVPPGGLEIGEYLRKKFGSRATVETIEGRVGEAGAEVGVTFDWTKVRRVNTFDAHRLLEWTLTEEGPAAQGRLKRRLMAGYFEDGADVSDHGVLAGLAAEVGLDPTAATEVLASGAFGAEVRAGEQEARELEIHAVPTFVIERRMAIPGAQDPETFVNLLARIRNRLADEAAEALDVGGDTACAADDPNC